MKDCMTGTLLEDIHTKIVEASQVFPMFFMKGFLIWIMFLVLVIMVVKQSRSYKPEV